MKKFIAVVLCMVMVTCLIPVCGLASDAQKQTVYYNEDFSDGVLDTDQSAGKPYWTIDNVTGGSAVVGADPTNSNNKCLILAKTTGNDGTKVETSIHMDDVVVNADKPYAVIEGRVMFGTVPGGTANPFYVFGGNKSAARLMTNSLYNNFMFSSGDSSYKYITGVGANIWYDVRYVVDTMQDINTYDVFVNDTYVITVKDPNAHGKFNAHNINKILFSLNNAAQTLYVDDISVYATADKGYTKEEHFYYSNDFSENLNTSKNSGKPYWALTETGGTITVGADPTNSANTCLVFDKTSDQSSGTKVEATLDLYDVKTSADSPYVVVEGRIMLSSRIGANVFFLFGGGKSSGRLMTNGVYAGGFVYSGADSTNSRIIPNYANNTWYTVKYVIDPSKSVNTYDVLVNGNYVKTISELPTGNSKFCDYDINRLLFGVNTQPGKLYLDDLKVYTTANKGYRCDFSDGLSSDAGQLKWIQKANNGIIDVVADPDNEYNKALAITATAAGQTPTVELELPAVYATSENPKLVIKGRYRANIGNSKQFYAYGNTNNSALGLNIFTYNNRMIANDRVAGGNSTNNTDYVAPFNPEKWYDVTVVFDTSTAEHTFDLYVDGELKLENLLTRMNMSSITKLLMDRTTAGTLYVDDLKVFNPGNGRIVTGLELSDSTFAIPAQDSVTYDLALNIKDETGASPEDAQVVWTVLGSKEGVVLNGSSLVVSSEASNGSLGLEAEVTVDGTSYKKSFVVDLGKGKYNFSDVLFTYDGTTPISTLEDGAALKVKLSATKIADDATGACFIAAVYNSADELVELEMAAPSVTKRGTPVEIPVNLPVGSSGGYVKVFKWNSVSGMIPYEATVSYPAQ